MILIKSINLKFLKYFCILLILFSTQISFAQYPDSPQPWNEAYNISIEGFKFKHPMTVFNAEEVDLIKKRLSYGIEPQATAFKELLNEATDALKFVPNPPSTLDIPGGYVDPDGLDYARTLLWDNCNAAYTCALAFTFTDSAKYAEKAISILMSWANKGTTFTGDDRGLQLGSYFSPMLYTADLLFNYEGWSSTDKELFKTWWKLECIINGDVLDVMRRKDNNWKDAGLLGTFAASVVFEDTAYLRESLIQLKSYFFTRTDENVKLPGASWKIANDQDGVYLPREVVRNDGSSGLTYTAYALTTMVQCFEIARYAGHNFWNDNTEHGVRILDVVNQYYEWDLRNEVFPWDADANRTDKRRNLYEVANSRYQLSQNIIDFIHLNRPVIGREGDAYTTLNKGDMNGWDTTTLSAPELILEPLSRNQILLKWTTIKENYYGVIIERKNNNSYLVLDTLKRNSVNFIDKNINDNTTYTYRIGLFNATGETVYSSEMSTTTPETPTEAPAPPTNLTPENEGSDRIKLKWDDNSDNEDGFIIERKSTDTYTIIGKTSVNETWYLDKDLELSTAYKYRVYAINPAGNSDYSNEASDTTLFVAGIFNENNGLVSIEAEYGKNGTRWNVKTNESIASGSKFIEVKSEYAHILDGPDCDLPSCYIVFYFNLSSPGNYSFWFRTLSTGGENDSFFWRIDGKTWIKENGRAMIGEWFFTNNTQTNNLDQGVHMLEIAGREDGTQLDKFLIQKSDGETPTGDGPPTSEVYGGWLPHYPTQLSIEANISDTIAFTWVDNSDNEDGFIIERQNGLAFEEIGETPEDAFSYIDTDITENTTYLYRIKSFNQFGQSIYSNTVMVKSIATSVFNTDDRYKITLYPNPTDSYVHINYYVSKRSDVSISLFSTIGKKIAILFNGLSEPGNHEIMCDIRNHGDRIIENGTYFCVLQFDSGSVVKKLVVM